MKVLLDLSYLGLARYVPSTRTGIFRVVEALALELPLLDGCQVEYCAADSFLRLQQTLDALESDGRFEGRSIAHERWARVPYLAQRAAISALWKKGPLHLAARALSRAQVRSCDALGQCFDPISKALLESAELLHSTYNPRILEAARQQGVATALTVYDSHHLDNFGSVCDGTWAICISEATRQAVIDRFNLTAERSSVAPLAADPRLFYPCRDEQRVRRIREKYRIPSGPYFLSVNTLQPRKNIERAVRCFGRVVAERQVQDATFVLVGANGFDWDAIHDAVERHSGAGRRIMIAGYVPDEDLAPLYSGALAFIYPSLMEGFGLPALEAMQCGTPVLTSNCSAMPEVVGDTALQVNPASDDEICAAMIRLYDDESLRSDLSQRAAVRARSFTWKRHAEDTLAAYRQAVA